MLCVDRESLSLVEALSVTLATLEDEPIETRHTVFMESQQNLEQLEVQRSGTATTPTLTLCPPEADTATLKKRADDPDTTFGPKMVEKVNHLVSVSCRPFAERETVGR